MIRKSFASAIAVLLLLALLPFLAAAEAEQVPATPTDLSCLHEHVKTTIYFFDSPAYTSVSAASHRVSGQATIETVCLDCGEVLSSEWTSSAEEIRPHRMKKGVCALCGFRQKNKAAVIEVADLPGEQTIYAQEDGTTKDLRTLTLSAADLAALEKANVRTVLIRGETGLAAIAVGVAQARTQVEISQASLYLELAEREDGSFFAGVSLVTGPGERTEPQDEGISLRFYQQTRADVRVSLAPTDRDLLVETQGEWDEHGFWSVPYLEKGTYFLLQ